MVIAVLNGSISIEAADGSIAVITKARTAAAAMYLPIHKRFSSATGRLPLRHAQCAGQLAEQFLQRPERTQPAAEHAAPDQHHRDERVDRDHDHQRLGQIEAYVDLAERPPDVIDHIDDRELHTCGPAEPDQNDQQESGAHQPVREAKARQRRLEYEDQGEHREKHGENRNVQTSVAPRLHPGGDGRRRRASGREQSGIL